MMEQLTKQRHNLGSGGVDVGKGLTFNDQVHVPLLAEREGVRVSISSLHHGIMKEKAKNEKGF